MLIGKNIPSTDFWNFQTQDIKKQHEEMWDLCQREKTQLWNPTLPLDLFIIEYLLCVRYCARHWEYKDK